MSGSESGCGYPVFPRSINGHIVKDDIFKPSAISKLNRVTLCIDNIDVGEGDVLDGVIGSFKINSSPFPVIQVLTRSAINNGSVRDRNACIVLEVVAWENSVESNARSTNGVNNYVMIGFVTAAAKEGNTCRTPVILDRVVRERIIYSCRRSVRVTRPDRKSIISVVSQTAIADYRIACSLSKVDTISQVIQFGCSRLSARSHRLLAYEHNPLPRIHIQNAPPIHHGSSS